MEVVAWGFVNAKLLGTGIWNYLKNYCADNLNASAVNKSDNFGFKVYLRMLYFEKLCQKELNQIMCLFGMFFALCCFLFCLFVKV